MNISEILTSSVFLGIRLRRQILTLFKNDCFLDAVYRNNKERFDDLIDQGLDPNHLRVFGKPVLHIATRLEHLSIVEALLENGADITGKAVGGVTALRIATENLYPEILYLLLKRGAPTDVFDNNGFDIVDFAANQRKQLTKLSGDIKAQAIRVCECLENPPLAEGPSVSQKKRYLEDEPPLPPASYGSEACRSFGITIADFFYDKKSKNAIPGDYQQHTTEFRHIRTHTVYDVLYTDILLKSSQRIKQQAQGVHRSFTWYHVPANNVSLRFVICRLLLISS